MLLSIPMLFTIDYGAFQSFKNISFCLLSCKLLEYNSHNHTFKELTVTGTQKQLSKNKNPDFIDKNTRGDVMVTLSQIRESIKW